jgi:hypothetical protein
MAAAMQLTGYIEPRRVARGSKSEHVASVLVDEHGVAHRLRRRGGPPFADPVLADLHGRQVRVTGDPREHFFLVDDWQLL